MIRMLWPLLLVVAANTVYHICARSTPVDVQPFASLTVTYLTAAALAATLFFATGGRNLPSEIHRANWTAAAFGASIVALEFGFIRLYRAGWKVSTGPLIANISLACVLLAVGVLLYRETVSPRQLAGVALCIAGVLLIRP